MQPKAPATAHMSPCPFDNTSAIRRIRISNEKHDEVDTCGHLDRDHHEGGPDHGEKVSIVFLANAIVEPLAVMIKGRDTLVTDAAVATQLVATV